MSVLYSSFELPSEIHQDPATASDTFGKFVAEPFERGFGHTVGNSLRRVLLSSIEAPAAMSFWMEGVSHEFSSVEGIIEDMVHIILNVKGSLFRRVSPQSSASKKPTRIEGEFEVTQADLDKSGGNVEITLGTLFQDGNFEIVNPDHYLFTVTAPMKKKVSMRVMISRGYVPSELHELDEKHPDEILVDSIFSPVKQVNYSVESTRVGKDTDYDRLVLEITTDGRMKPAEALALTSQIAAKQYEPFASVKDLELTFEEDDQEEISDKGEVMHKLSLKINDIEFSVRASNCLAGAEIDTLAELVIKPEAELLKFRNFGKKSLGEIKQKLSEMGLHLGMELSPYGITRENIREVIQSYIEERASVK